MSTERHACPCCGYLTLEGEGGKIGKIFLPRRVADAVRGGMAVLISAPLERRTQRIVREYAPETWSVEDVERFRRSLAIISARLPRDTARSLETAFDDGRFTDVVKGLLVAYYDPLYLRSSVEGRDFVIEFQTSSDPNRDARRFAHEIVRVIGKVFSGSRATDR